MLHSNRRIQFTRKPKRKNHWPTHNLNGNFLDLYNWKFCKHGCQTRSIRRNMTTKRKKTE